MNKKIYIGLVVFFVIFAVGTSIATFVSQKNSYQAKTQIVNDQTSEKNNELDALNANKDKNGFLPSDVVKNFMNEIKNDSQEKAKLYVVESKRDQDLGKWLNVTDMLTQINTTDASYSITDDNATVSYSGFIKEEGNILTRVFSLIKENDAWRISDIKES